MIYDVLQKEWHPTKNTGLILVDFHLVQKKVWWICEKGHEWEASPNNRKNGTGCPHCAGRIVTLETCLAAISPELEKDWHPEKNNEWNKI
ncbi:zinc-ribbon domain-containing protein [[Brevibacterium] frigoritolerans]|nr:zinc-ribbon domain-containing protein [Peribacillus frigoritolerans]